MFNISFRMSLFLIDLSAIEAFFSQIDTVSKIHLGRLTEVFKSQTYSPEERKVSKERRERKYDSAKIS